MICTDTCSIFQKKNSENNSWCSYCSYSLPSLKGKKHNNCTNTQLFFYGMKCELHIPVYEHICYENIDGAIKNMF